VTTNIEHKQTYGKSLDN